MHSPESDSSLENDTRSVPRSGSVLQRMGGVAAVAAALLGSAKTSEAQRPTDAPQNNDGFIELFKGLKTDSILAPIPAVKSPLPSKPEMMARLSEEAEYGPHPDREIKDMVSLDPEMAKPHLLQLIRKKGPVGWNALVALCRAPYVTQEDDTVTSLLSETEILGFYLMEHYHRDTVPDTGKVLREGKTIEHKTFAAFVLGNISRRSEKDCEAAISLLEQILDDESLVVKMTCADYYFALPIEKQTYEARRSIAEHLINVLEVGGYSERTERYLKELIQKGSQPMPPAVRSATAREFCCVDVLS